MHRFKEAKAALSELAFGSPAVAADPAHYLGGYIFIDALVEDVVEGLRRAGWNESESVIHLAGE